MSTTTVDEARLEALTGRVAGYMTGTAVGFWIMLGDDLGLYRAMAGAGHLSPEDLAERTGCHPRLLREWLLGQAAAGLVDHDGTATTFVLTPEAGLLLADDTSPVFLARGLKGFAPLFLDAGKIGDAFRGDGGLSWAMHSPELFEGTEWFFRTGYRALLTTQWIPALDGVDERLRAGARVADVGCGHGASVIVMAEAYPASTFHGFDFHERSIEVARRRAAEAGVADRATFDVASSKGYDGTYDLICFFDCLHDMGDAVGVANYARDHLAPGGTVLLVEPFMLDAPAENVRDNPLAALGYHASSAICTPNSLSQDGPEGAGPPQGEAQLRQLFEAAGFTKFRRAAATPLNLILEAKP